MSRTRTALVSSGTDHSRANSIADLATCTGTDGYGGTGTPDVRTVHGGGVPDPTANRAEVPGGDDAD